MKVANLAKSAHFWQLWPIFAKHWQMLSKMKAPPSLGPHQDLGEVAVGVLLSILSLQVLLLYQDIDAFLDHWDLGLEPGF